MTAKKSKRYKYARPTNPKAVEISPNSSHGLIFIILIVFAALFVYSNTFNSAFHFDDERFIAQNPAVHHIANIFNIWKYWPSRFTVFLSLAANYHVNGLDVFGYHLFNIIIHISSALVVRWLVLLLLSTPAMRNDSLNKQAGLVAFFAGLIFAVHPIQTQGVTYIFQRAASMAALFYILALSLYIKSRILFVQTGLLSRSRPFYIFSILFCAVAMLTKENSITLPVMIAAVELIFFNTDGQMRLAPIIPFFLMLPIIPSVLAQSKTENITEMQRLIAEEKGGGKGSYLITQFRVMITYLRLIFLPIRQCFDYDYRMSSSILEPRILASIVVILSILAASVKAFAKYRIFTFITLWFFITLLPESSIVPTQDVIFEHRMYLPMVGGAIFFPFAAWYIFGEKRIKSAICLLCIIALCYAGMAYQRNEVWRDDIGLWKDALKKFPQKARPYNIIGINWAKTKKPEAALSYLKRAVYLKPDYADAYYNMGCVYLEGGEYKKAINSFTKAIAITPNDTDAHYYLGRAYSESGDMKNGVSELSRAIGLNSGYLPAYMDRGMAFQKLKDWNGAIKDFNKVIDLDPGSAPAYLERGNAYFYKKDYTPAIADYTKAIAINPALPGAYNNRAVAYFLKNMYDASWDDVKRYESFGSKMSARFKADLVKASGRSE